MEGEEAGEKQQWVVVKKRLCDFWKQGKCERGSKCILAHAEEEIGTRVIEKPCGKVSGQDMVIIIMLTSVSIDLF